MILVCYMSVILVCYMIPVCLVLFSNPTLMVAELEQRQKRGQLDARTLLLTVEDPQDKVGSGGATLNALLVVAEHISAKQGFTVSFNSVYRLLWILFLI